MTPSIAISFPFKDLRVRFTGEVDWVAGSSFAVDDDELDFFVGMERERRFLTSALGGILFCYRRGYW
jgi:hypothetical protein